MAEEFKEPTKLPGRTPDEGVALGLLLEAARNAVDWELRRSEKLDDRSRNQFAAVGALFTVAMATTAGVLSALAVSRSGLAAWIAIVVGILAVVALAALGWAFERSVRAWKPQAAGALDPATLREYIPFAEDGNVGVAKRLIEAYADILERRRAANATRLSAGKCAAQVCALAAVASVVELAFVFVALAVK
jgi:hypothetical protein